MAASLTRSYQDADAETWQQIALGEWITTAEANGDPDQLSVILTGSNTCWCLFLPAITARLGAGAARAQGQGIWIMVGERQQPWMYRHR
ncbi:hypothetical protein CKO42_19670 [Lamprobacter modestohalophilus]|uniref:Uncharacterized protein n=1 Tax=Lamprobacter modestohalophilus TaxID=1064514 RepID=A0A9X0WBG8_9GAMM|nr:hypothetical protein [Lamprobacter modestohalophilus]